MAKPLNGLEFIPITGFCIVGLKCQILADLVRPATNHKHERAQEDGAVLIPLSWKLPSAFIWCADPIPPAIAVTPEAPGIVERRLVASAAAKNYHHPIR